MIAYYIIFPIIFFIVAVFLSQKDILLTVAFFLLLNVFLKFFLFKTIPHIAFASGTFISIAIVLFFLFKAAITPAIINKKHTVYILGSVAIFFLYLFCLAAFRSDDPADYILFFRNFFFNYLLLIVFLADKSHKILSANFYINFILLLTVIQASLGIAQHLNSSVADFFIITEYVRQGEVIQRISPVFHGQKLVTGTLLSAQGVSIFLMLNIVFLITLSAFRFVMTDRKTLFLVVLTVLTMILSGVRAPMIGLFVGLMIVLWFKSKKWFILTLLAFVIFVPLWIVAIEPRIAFALSQAGSSNLEDPVSRIFGAFAIFKPEYLEQTSINRTYILSEYFFINPLFGTGPGIIFSDYSISDAFNILIVVEFGLVGYILLIYPYFYILKKTKHLIHPYLFKAGIVIFLVALSQSITNEGLWTSFTNIQFFFMLMVLIRMNSKPLYRTSNINK